MMSLSSNLLRPVVFTASSLNIAMLKEHLCFHLSMVGASGILSIMFSAFWALVVTKYHAR